MAVLDTKGLPSLSLGYARHDIEVMTMMIMIMIMTMIAMIMILIVWFQQHHPHSCAATTHSCEAASFPHCWSASNALAAAVGVNSLAYSRLIAAAASERPAAAGLQDGVDRRARPTPGPCLDPGGATMPC